MARPRRPRDPILAGPTWRTAVLGALPGTPPSAPVRVTSFSEYLSRFGTQEGEVADAVRLYFDNGGRDALVAALDESRPLESLDALAGGRFDLLVIPPTARLPEPEATSLAVAAALLAEDRPAFYVVDPPATRTAANVARWAGSFGGGTNAAVYFPRVRLRDASGERDVPAAAAVAGLMAQTDLQRGVWVAPGGTTGRLTAVVGVSVDLTDAAADALVQAAVNPIRTIQGRGHVVWSNRTRADTDSEWKYVNVRRLAVFLERSIEQGLQWVVFAPNDERLWTKVRAAVRSFLAVVFRQGAFPASRPQEAFFVRCDRTTMTQDDIDAGRLVLQIGMAPVRPAEFVILRIGLWARPPDDDD